MATLTGVSISSSYTSLLKLDGNTDSTAAGNGSNAIQVKTGDNEATPLFLNTDRLGIGGQPSAIFHSKGTNAGASLTLAMLENVTSDANSEARLFFVSGGNSTRGSYITSINTSASGQPADLAFATSSAYATPTERMRITSGGSVGIGESSSIDKKLHIKSSTSGDGITIENSSTGASVVRFEADSSALRGIFGVEDHDGGSTITGSSGYATFIRSEANIQFASGGNNLAMTIDSSQHVGIGVIPDGISFRVEKEVNGNWAGLIKNTHATNGSGLKVQAGDDANVDSFRVANVSNTTLFNINGAGTSAFSGDVSVIKGSDASTQNVLGVGKAGNIESSGGGSAFLTVHGNTANQRGQIELGSDNLVGDGTTMGRVFFYNLDGGSSVVSRAQITAMRDGADDASKLVFATEATSGDVTDAMIIDSEGTVDQQGNYILNEQGRQNHVANTMSSPYYYFPSSSSYITAGTGNADLVVAEKASWVVCGAFGSTNNNTRFLRSTDGINLEIQSNTTLNVEIYHSSTTAVRNITNVIDNDMSIHCFAITYNEDNDKKIKVYKDGVLQTGGTDTAGAGSLNSASGDEFVIGNTHAKSAGFIGSLYDVKVFNTALNATEVKEIYSGMSVPFKYKGANQTNILTGVHDDFDTDVANQSAFNSNYTQLQATGFVGSGGAISVSSNVMAMTGIVSGHGINGLGLLTKGKKYRMTFNVTAITGNWYLDFLNQSESAFSGTGLKTVEWTAGGSDLNIYSGGSGGALTIDASSTVVELIPIGAVAEYNGSGITENKWYDGSGNELHGTVSGASDENTASAPVLSDNHPAFLVQPNAEQTNIAVDSTVDIVFDVERFDQGSNFASNTFTAPVTGKYFLNVSLYGKQVDSASDYIQVYITTSNRTYTMIIDPDFGQDAAYWSFNNSVLADMDVNDTAKIQVFQSTGSAQLDIGTASYFSGYLVC